jgi:1-acyl-sn-glycerol-3-phosphate acyltransferase
LIRHAGSIAIASPGWRDRISARLAEGQKLVVFPEGQRWIRAQDFHAELAPFHPGFAVFAHEARVPVVPVVIERLAFSVVPSLISPILRDLSDDPELLEQPAEVLRYRACRVRVLEPIAPSRFAGLPKKRAIEWLVEEAHTRMSRALGLLPSPLSLVVGSRGD